MLSCRCSTYPDFIMQVLEQKITLKTQRNVPHWSVEETMAQWNFQEPVWSEGNGWYWTKSRGWFELIPRNRGKGTGAHWNP